MNRARGGGDPAWLFAAIPFPAGAVLLTGTGTGSVSPESSTLTAGGVVAGIGVLENPVREVGIDLRGRPKEDSDDRHP